MLKISLTTCLMMSFVLNSNAQTVNDVLTKSISVKKEEKIFLYQKGGTATHYNLATTNNFKPYVDSTIFVIHKSGVNIHLQTLNPLRYSYDTSLKIIADPIMADAEKAFESIYTMVSSVSPPLPGSKRSRDDNKLSSECKSLDIIVAKAQNVAVGLEADMKNEILRAFNLLRDLEFTEEKKKQCEDIDKIETDSIERIRKHYKEVNGFLDEIKTRIKEFSCSREDSIVIKYVLTQIVKDLVTSYNIKKTRLDNLEKALKLVRRVCTEAKFQAEFEPVWFNEPIFVNTAADKIALLTVTINANGMEEKDGEIVTTEKKPLATKMLRFRRYQQFVPEVSAGVAYTALSFPKYGTTTDSTGKQYVSEAGEENFKRLNFTAMINLIYYNENWNVHPLLQIGIGHNTDYPTILTGIGMRLNIGQRRIALSTGGAFSWIKTLDKLKIGDEVSGTSDIEADLKHEFQSPKLYFGIQYNF